MGQVPLPAGELEPGAHPKHNPDVAALEYVPAGQDRLHEALPATLEEPP
jgi:hypothetical protein